MSGRVAIFFVGGALVGLGLLLHIVGLATPVWSSYKDPHGYKYNMGLWKACSPSECMAYTNKSDNLKAAEAFAVIGMLFGIAAVVTVIINVLLAVKGAPNKCLAILTLLASFLALATVEVGAGIWGSASGIDLSYHLGYSFGLSVAGGVLISVGGLISFLGTPQATGYQNIP